MKTFLFALLALVGLQLGAKAQAVLRSDDTIEIRLGGVPSEFIGEFSAQYTIDHEGNLNLPYIGNVKVGGLLPSQAEKTIEDTLKAQQIYTHPTITITTQQTQRLITLAGAVRSPGRIQYTSDLTITSAINAAGGPSDFAGDGITLTRDGKRSSYSLKKLQKNPALDIKVIPGDQISVAQSWF
ncbi:MAG: polysaccharide biosynthesis/export family protein [Chthoniobacteraceae bacterium]